MPKYTEDRCGGCNLITSPERLFKKIVSFVRKSNNKPVKQRTVMWLCDDCMASDDDFKMPPRSGPGHTSPALERARRMQQGGLND